MTAPTRGADDTGPPPFAGWRGLGWALLVIAAGMRINNALRYRTGSGFDAVENADYIERLMRSWSLPAPDAGWATSHPPLFYYLSAAIGRILALFGEERLLLQIVPLAAGAASIAIALLAFEMVRRAAPSESRRAVVAGALVLYLPVSIYMSAMLSEEMLAALLTSLVLVGGIHGTRETSASGKHLLFAACLGAVAGLALLTKLSGALVALAVGLAWLLAGYRSGRIGPAVGRVSAMAVGTLLVGGWFYLRNWLEFGYLYPQDLSSHALMFEMPPGQRGVLDYLRFPLATFTDPQLLNADLLHSVWGSTYATIWFDGHRHFLTHSAAVSRMGGILLLLGLLPSAAFFVGLGRGLRRSLRDPGGPDAAMLLLVGLTLAGYVAFTWGNPWFATLKGSYLLGLSLPFGYYASEGLCGWARSPTARSRVLWGILVLLLVLVTVTFTIGPVFTKLDGPGLPWRTLAPTG